MKYLSLLPVCALAVMPLLAKPVALEKLHPAIKDKIAAYCPDSIDQEQIASISKGEEIEVKGITFANEDKKLKDFQATEGKLCSASLAQNRSTPTKVECGYCGEEKKAGLIITARIDSETMKKYAEALEEEKNEEKNLVSEEESAKEVQNPKIEPASLKR